MRFPWNLREGAGAISVSWASRLKWRAEIFHDPNHVVTANHFIEKEGAPCDQAIGARRRFWPHKTVEPARSGLDEDTPVAVQALLVRPMLGSRGTI
jgi:hypothetical protein